MLLRPLCGATVALGAALVAHNLNELTLYEPAPGISGVPNEDVERIDDLVAHDEREEALVHANRDDVRRARANAGFAYLVRASRSRAYRDSQPRIP